MVRARPTARTGREQRGLTLVELLLTMAVAAMIIGPLALAIRNGVGAQTAVTTGMDVHQQARFAMQRMTAAVQRTPAGTTLGSKAANTSGNWFAPAVFCLNGAGALIETDTLDLLCGGSAVIASGVTNFSVQTYAAGAGAAPVIEIQLALAGGQGAAIALTARTRLGGGTL